MKLSTDDDIYRARLVYLGPPGYTFPVQLPYAQYGLFVILAAVLTAVAMTLTGTWKSGGASIGAAIFMTAYIWRHVNPDRPARKVIKVALIDRKSIQPPAKDQLPRLTAGHIRFSEITTEPKDDR